MQISPDAIGADLAAYGYAHLEIQIDGSGIELLLPTDVSISRDPGGIIVGYQVTTNFPEVRQGDQFLLTMVNNGNNPQEIDVFYGGA